MPIVVDKDDVIICGHTRLLAAKKLGLQQVPVHVADNLTPAQVKAYRLMDNRCHEDTDWDLDLLGPELEELASPRLRLESHRFRRTRDRSLSRGLRSDEDRANAAPPVPDNPVARPGDLWVCGKAPDSVRRRHQPEAVARLLGGEAALDGDRSAVRRSSLIRNGGIARASTAAAPLNRAT